LLEDRSLPNDFYRALGVPPPPPNAIWIVYEYAGLSTLQTISQPADLRRNKLPPKRGFFGAVTAPPPVPSWKERANYIKLILKQAIQGVATLHETGLVHQSIGQSSIVVTTTAMDKRLASSPYATTFSTPVQIKLADFGFCSLQSLSTMDEEFCSRARSFGLMFQRGQSNVDTANYSMAEDMNALGFLFLGLVLSSLAESNGTTAVPATDEDTLQRLLGDIFEKDMEQFRDYVENEDVWDNVVEWLDEEKGAGWKVLETLVLAREQVAAQAKRDSSQLVTIRGLLSNPFFQGV
jgi:serine/threonine protein kinase